jgi:ABC-2 type transport system permease protein
MSALGRSELGLQTAPIAPTGRWLVVAEQEFRDIWLSWRGPIIVFAFSLLLSLLTYLAAANKELNIIDQRDTVNLIVQITLGIGVAASLVFAADAVSGERERETLESLLLTPVPRRQIALGKLLAAVSLWPVMILVAVPYIWVLRAGPSLFSHAVVAGFVVGSLLTIAFASLGMIVSIFSNSNRASLVVSFFVFVVLAAPTQLTLQGWLAGLLNRANPATAAAEYMHRILVSDHTLTQDASWLASPVVAALIAAAAVFFIAARLRLQGGIDR